MSIEILAVEASAPVAGLVSVKLGAKCLHQSTVSDLKAALEELESAHKRLSSEGVSQRGLHA